MTESVPLAFCCALWIAAWAASRERASCGFLKLGNPDLVGKGNQKKTMNNRFLLCVCVFLMVK